MTNSENMLRLLAEQDIQGAEEYFQKALQEDHSEILFELGMYLEQIGFYPQARQIYEQLVADFPEALLHLAQIANEDGQIEQAFAYLEQIPTDSPDYLSSLVVKADIYQSEGLVDVAREKMREATSLSSDPILLFGLGELQMELGEFQEAIYSYAQLDNRDLLEITGVSTYQRIGLAYANLGKFEPAIEFFEKAIEIEYDDQTVYELAILLLDQEEFQQAIFYFKQLDTMNPDFQGYEYAYAKALHGEHRVLEALEVLEKGLAKNPFDTVLLLFASQLSFENHDEVKSEYYLLQAKEEAEDLDEVILRLSNLYLRQQRYQDILELPINQVDSVLARWNLAKAQQALEAEKEALALYEELRDDLATNPDFLMDYVTLLRQVGKQEQAKEYTQHYLRIVPDDMMMQEFYND